jgi:hypothetical protein
MANHNIACPQDIKPPWLNVVRRLQSVSKTGGLALVSITVLVDSDGVPKLWLEPKCERIEPRKRSREIIEMLASTGDISER